MAQFNVNISTLKNKSGNLSKMNEDLKKIANSVLIIQENLDFTTSQRDSIIRTLNGIEADILEEALMMENLGKALTFIANKYQNTENEIIARASRPDFINNISDFFENTGKKFLEMLGLDDDYYRLLMGAEQFDRDRTQEQLMDQYLQTVINDKLNEDRFSQDTWNNATPEEREQMLNDFLREINTTMGTDVQTTIIIEDSYSGTSTRGSYGNGVVRINPDYLSDSDPNSYMVMRTMIHEMRHAYQHAAIENPDQFLVSEETRDKWSYNFDHYKDGDHYGYEAYVSQAIEYDAKNFAEQYGDIAGITPEYEGSW